MKHAFTVVVRIYSSMTEKVSHFASIAQMVYPYHDGE